MHIGGKGIENLFMNVMLKRKENQKDISKKHLVMPLYVGMG